MPIFIYKALDKSGSLAEDEIIASDRSEAIEKIKSINLVPLEISERATSSTSGKRSAFLGAKFIKKGDINNFTTRLAALVRSKMPLAKALKSLTEQSEKEALEFLINDITNQVLEGETLSNALASHSKYFSKLYINMVRIGEIKGVLDEALTKITEIQKRDREFISSIKGAVTYPAVMLVVMISAIAVLITFVIPKFTESFAGMGLILPLPTRILIRLSDIFGNYWWAIIILIGIIIGGFIMYNRSENGKYKLDKIKLKMPSVGSMILQMAISRYTLSLGSLLKSGVNLVDALEATATMTGNTYITESLIGITSEVKEGVSLNQAFKKRKFFFTNLAVQMTQTGEDSGTLGEMLINVGEYYSEESSQKIKTVTRLIEPVMIIIMGVIVGFIVVAMLLPIFDMSSGIK
jgi:type II secretory pathway component PulF